MREELALGVTVNWLEVVTLTDFIVIEPYYVMSCKLDGPIVS